MEKLSVMGFKNLCDENAPMTFIYDTENQPNGELRDVKMMQKYTELVCMLNPNRIMLKNERGTFCLNRVKCIKCYKEIHTSGYLFSVVCGNHENGDEDASYTLLADKKNFSE